MKIKILKDFSYDQKKAIQLLTPSNLKKLNLELPYNFTIENSKSTGIFISGALYNNGVFNKKTNFNLKQIYIKGFSFAWLEFDNIDFEEQFEIINKIGIEPTLIVHSGNNSLHVFFAFYYVNESIEDQKLILKLLSKIYGSDPKVARVTQPMRMPGNKIEREQPIVYWSEKRYDPKLFLDLLLSKDIDSSLMPKNEVENEQIQSFIKSFDSNTTVSLINSNTYINTAIRTLYTIYYDFRWKKVEKDNKSPTFESLRWKRFDNSLNSLQKDLKETKDFSYNSLKANNIDKLEAICPFCNDEDDDKHFNIYIKENKIECYCHKCNTNHIFNINPNSFQNIETLKINKRYLGQNEADYINNSNKKFIGVKSITGTAKTELIKLLEGKRILLIMPRCSLADNLHSRLKDLRFENYLDYKGYEIPDIDKIIITPNSLGKLIGRKFDLIIVDESEIVFQMLSSDTINQPTYIINSLDGLIKKSDKLVLMDANLSENTFKWYSKNSYNCSLILNEYKSNKIFKLISADKRVELINSMSDSVNKIAVGLTRKSILKSDIGLYNKKFKTYSGDTNNKDFENINEVTQKHNVMFTPAMGVGIDIQTPMNYFVDLKNGYYNDIYNSIQMLGRIRNAIDNTIYVTLESPRFKKETDIDKIKEDFLTEIDKNIHTCYNSEEILNIKKSKRVIDAFVIKNYNLNFSMNNYFDLIIEFMFTNGEIEIIPDTNNKIINKHRSLYNKNTKKELVEKIKNAHTSKFNIEWANNVIREKDQDNYPIAKKIILQSKYNNKILTNRFIYDVEFNNLESKIELYQDLFIRNLDDIINEQKNEMNQDLFRHKNNATLIKEFYNILNIYGVEDSKIIKSKIDMKKYNDYKYWNIWGINDTKNPLNNFSIILKKFGLSGKSKSINNKKDVEYIIDPLSKNYMEKIVKNIINCNKEINFDLNEIFSKYSSKSS